MAKYKCVTKCYFQEKVWDRGDVLSAVEDVEVPRHFIPMTDAPVEDIDELDEPETLSELQAKEDKELAESGADPTAEAPEAPGEDFLD